jgi:uncharacterized damage-inducible protein DinB
MEERIRALAQSYLEQYLRRIQVCVDGLSEEQVWWRANDASNSVGNILLHLCGNLSQWILSTLGSEAFERHRTEEFSARGNAAKEELVERLAGIVDRCSRVIGSLTEADLESPRRVQGRDTDGIGVVVHVVEHMSYHAGQIVFVTKELLGPAGSIDFDRR